MELPIILLVSLLLVIMLALIIIPSIAKTTKLYKEEQKIVDPIILDFESKIMDTDSLEELAKLREEFYNSDLFNGSNYKYNTQSSSIKALEGLFVIYKHILEKNQNEKN